MDLIQTYTILSAIVIGFVSWLWIKIYLGTVKPIPGVRKLVVTAHPDDESMFFAPFIAWETSRGSSVHLICLSDGDYDGQGLLRSKELKEACHELGVPDRFLKLIRSSKFRDDPGSLWDTNEIRKIVDFYCKEHDIEAVVTFDSHGVSGHLNHVSIYHALASLSGGSDFRPRVYALESVFILRKYFLLFDVLYAVLQEPDHVYSLSPELSEKPRRAMLKHRSQLLWFRHFYMWFSKYMVVNTFRELSPER